MTVLAFVISFLAVASVSSFHDGRITSGRDVDITQFPYQVQIVRDVKTWRKGVYTLPSLPTCGGSIIGKNLVLTAAHCLNEKKRDKRTYCVRAGTSYATGEGASWHRIIDVKLHEHYKRDRVFYNDIALVIVEPRFQFDETRQPISLPHTSAVDESTGTFTSWNNTKSLHPCIVRKLQMTELTVFIGIKCNNDDIHTFCAYGEGVSAACDGGSGGPLVAHNRLVGIALYNLLGECGAPGLPTLFANVASYTNWIMENKHNLTYS